MISSFLKRLLLLGGYPRLMTFHDPHKSHGSSVVVVGGAATAVGAIQVRIPNTIQAQVFYPSTTEGERGESSSSSYFREKSAKGLIDYMNGLGDGILQFVAETPHPCCYEADPIVPPNDGALYPLVVFSHGLAGSMELYTQLCSVMASYGFVVVAVEHEDGSAAYAETLQGVPITYKRPNDEPYSRRKVLNLRTPMLEQRVQELEDVIKYFINAKMTSESKGGNEREFVCDDDEKACRVLHQLASTCVDPTQVHLAGHSFGGATQVMAAQKWSQRDSRHQTDDAGKVRQPKSITLLDAWAFALDDRVLETGLSTRIDGEIAMPILSVISEAWTTNPETDKIIQLLQSTVRRSCCDDSSSNESPSTNGIHSFFCKHSVHQSFSDTEAWLPSWVSKRMFSRGKQEKRHNTILAVAAAWKRLTMLTPQHPLVESCYDNELLISFKIPVEYSTGELTGKAEALTQATSSISA